MVSSSLPDKFDPGTADVNGWSLKYNSFDPEAEGRREALCTLGNGYFATRGAAPEATADSIHYPGTYVAGLYNRRVTQVAQQRVENESVVNVPNWLSLSFQIDDGPWFALGDVETLDYSQELNLRHATVTRSVRVRDAAGRRDSRRPTSIREHGRPARRWARDSTLR